MSAKTLIVAVAALAASGAAALPASAAPDTGKMPLRAAILFNLIDRNGDGSIDKDELDAVRNAIFAAIDTNGDGKISKEELQAVGQGMRERAMQRWQFMHRPGGPERFGWQGGPPQWRGQDGRDGRGPMFDGGPRQPGPRQGMMDDRQGPPPGVAPSDAPGQGFMPGPQDLASADKNGDGSISRDEFSVQQFLPGLAQLLGE